MRHGTWFHLANLTALLSAAVAIALGVDRPLVAQESRVIPRSLVNKNSANLPIDLDPRARPHVKEVQLYVKENPQAPWVLRDRVPATQPFFHFKAPHDGEYFFCVVTVDRQGRSTPTDIAVLPPGLIVVFDTQAPKIEAHALNVSADGVEVRCEIRDSNPDPTKTRLFYQTRDQRWRHADLASGKNETFFIPNQAAFTGLVRVTACDLANNTITNELSVAMPQTVAAANPTVDPLQALPVDTLSERLLPIPTGTVDKGHTVPQRSLSERVEFVSFKQEALQRAPEPTNVPTGPELRPTLEKTPEKFRPILSGKRYFANTTRVLLDYQIEQTGPSGVGRIEFWMTRDLGRTWQKLGHDLKRKSPAELDLPGEGVFGITMIVCNGRGLGGGPPASGDDPEMWLEVDTTPPTADLTGVGNAPDGSLHIAWRAADHNLGEEPIDLYYSANRNGPWQPIAKGLKNTGGYRWTPTPDAGAQGYFRLVVHDMAGNTSVSETSQQGTSLGDQSRPRGRLLGVSTAPR